MEKRHAFSYNWAVFNIMVSKCMPHISAISSSLKNGPNILVALKTHHTQSCIAFPENNTGFQVELYLLFTYPLR
jgi:hypothetical protein